MKKPRKIGAEELKALSDRRKDLFLAVFRYGRHRRSEARLEDLKKASIAFTEVWVKKLEADGG